MTYRREQNPVMVGLCVLLLAGAMIAYWQFFLALGVGVASWNASRELRRAALRRRVEHAAIAARADHEHRLIRSCDGF
jgi:hypothetical protein